MKLYIINGPNLNRLGTREPSIYGNLTMEQCLEDLRKRYAEKVEIDYTQKKNVKKPNGAKPGMVIYDNYNTVYVTPKNMEQA